MLCERPLNFRDASDTKNITDLRSELGLTHSKEEMWAVEGRMDEQGFPILPHWLAQPYFRQPIPDQDKNEGAAETGTKRTAEDPVDNNGNSASITTTGDEYPQRTNKKVKKAKDLPNLCHGTSCRNTHSVT
ncbi:hypothetical protein BGZ65_005981, partial [Modicella reniformis]